MSFVTLDTNILLATVLPPSPYHWVYQALRNQQYGLVVSTDILEEYEEKLSEFYGSTFANAVLSELLNLENVQRVSPTFFWRMIHKDHDDDKFIDAYVAANALYLISEDAHYKDIFKVDFPPVQWMKFAQFMNWLNGKPAQLQRKRN
jgi:putative PIN family toxin of toxin-antitoxin system